MARGKEGKRLYKQGGIGLSQESRGRGKTAKLQEGKKFGKCLADKKEK